MNPLGRPSARLGRVVLASVAMLVVSAPLCSGQDKAKPAPTYQDVAYGTHERNVLDFWRAESATPTPQVVYIHGGGFTGGNKNSLNANTLRELLAAGISVAAIHYRLISHGPLPAAHFDSRRALQFLRSKAKEWNIDKTRVGAFGGSAGAQICMWLAFHDEMADPKSADPVERRTRGDRPSQRPARGGKSVGSRATAGVPCRPPGAVG